jgi:hypothetical protein
MTVAEVNGKEDTENTPGTINTVTSDVVTDMILVDFAKFKSFKESTQSTNTRKNASPRDCTHQHTPPLLNMCLLIHISGN